MTTATKRQRPGGRLGRAASLGLFALAALLCQSHEARAQWTTSGANTTTTSNVGVGTTAPAARVHILGTNAPLDYTGAPAPDALNVMGGLGGNGTWGASAGGVGGALKLQGGKGGSPVAGSSVTGFGGFGGAVHITGGTGGDNTFNTRAGHGGNVFLNGGDIGSAPAPGAVSGHVILANLRGNVGVGTTTPTFKFDVAGQIRSSAGGFVFPDGTVQSTAYVGGSGTGTTATSLAATNVSAGPFGANVGGGIFSFPSNLGIGTVSPAVKLAVNGPGVNVYNTDAWIENNIHVQGNEVISQGGGRGRMRVGTAWGYVGLYAESSSAGAANDLVLGAGSGTVRVGPGGASIVQSFVVPNGNVGIGTAAPAQKLDVRGNILMEAGSGPTIYTGAAAAELNRYLNIINSPGLTSASGVKAGGLLVSDNYAYANPGKNDVIVKGNVGIGIAAPTARLHVAGDIIVDGNITAKYQDVAEWVPTKQRLSAGTVVVLDPDHSNHVLASTSSYDTAVAGVISAKPGLSLGEAGEGKALVATTGRVKVRVDATRGAIKIGDLIVTSDVAGMAMKSVPVVVGGRRIHAPGTIIGKALEPLAGGTGEILVLLSLQ